MKKKLILILCACLAAAISTAAVLQNQQQVLSQKLIRLHVVANSDTAEDQAVKLLVRDEVLKVTQPLLADQSDPDQTLEDHLSDIQLAAEQCLRNAGSHQPVTVTLQHERFPTRVYDTFSLPAGVYRSLRVTIGRGEGKNWWCVVYPSICFRATAEDLEAAAETGGFSKGEFNLITEENEVYILKFKLLEWLDQMKTMIFA